MSVQSSSASLTLRALLKQAVGNAALFLDTPILSGLSVPAKALAVSAAARDGSLIVVVPTDQDVDDLAGDIAFFLAGLEGLTDSDVGDLVLTYPSLEVDPYRGLKPHLDVASARARALHGLASRTARVVVASAAGIVPRVSAPGILRAAGVELHPGDEMSPIDLGDLLLRAGFTREDPVDTHGEYCVRGGVVDFFPAGEDRPSRIEFVGDTIESIRTYDPGTQRSVATLDVAKIVPLREPEEEEGRPAGRVPFTEFVRSTIDARMVTMEHEAVEAAVRKAIAQVEASHADAVRRGEAVAEPDALIACWDELAPALAAAIHFEELELGGEGAGGRHVSCQPAVEYRGRVGDWAADIRRAREGDNTVLIVAGTHGRSERIAELLADYEIAAVPIERADEGPRSRVILALGHLSRGFFLPDAGLQVYAETDVFEEEQPVRERRKSLARTFLSDFRDLKVGDHVVHVDNGIGVFVGLKKIDVGYEQHEFMELRYAGDDKLFVPVERLDLVQKYSGGSAPALDRLGGATWERAKTRVKKAMRDMAEELLRLYAARKAIAGHAFSPDTHWQQEFEDAFQYELTVDQKIAIADIKRDMEAPTPMDRLLCGDVGYGKTEVAMRAAFKAVMDGKQVALLAPTTVLAFQHLKTLTQRFSAFPVRIDMVSRFRSRAEQKETIARLADGSVDIIVGTHRLLSKDVSFKDVGLLVVDEEQRFGVTHKERIKQWKRRVDVLTMTATPIPRTLNMSLVGIRDMSIIETPPKDRLSIQTHVVKFDQGIIARAVRHELERGGQVYLVHNRVESIYSIGNLVTRLVPEARVAVAHGQMGEDELERVMVDFVARKHDVLVATTIIENGLDIANANTLIVNRADRFGLAQLYQLRGRVGRSDRRAYAYLLIPPEGSLSAVARKRLAAIREFSDLGSGFRIAALDLEIRGAGNLLGGEQSGHIDALGFEMYMKLLEQTIREIKGEELDEEARASVNLRVDLRVDEDYIPDMIQRLAVYRRIASSRSEQELTGILAELADRYGPAPPSVLNLGAYGRIRVLAERVGLDSIDREGHVVVLKFRNNAPVDPQRIVALVRERVELSLVPPSTLKLDLRKVTGGPRPSPAGGPSWWTTRATAGEVRPGFTKHDILRPAAEDPRGPEGIFTRVGALLVELSEGGL